jgi:hypothetical protein
MADDNGRGIARAQTGQHLIPPIEGVQGPDIKGTPGANAERAVIVFSGPALSTGIFWNDSKPIACFEQF